MFLALISPFVLVLSGSYIFKTNNVTLPGYILPADPVNNRKIPDQDSYVTFPASTPPSKSG